MEYSFREARMEDAAYVADHIKADDLQELQALCGGNVYNELVASIRDSVVSADLFLYRWQAYGPVWTD